MGAGGGELGGEDGELGGGADSGVGEPGGAWGRGEGGLETAGDGEVGPGVLPGSSPTGPTGQQRLPVLKRETTAAAPGKRSSGATSASSVEQAPLVGRRMQILAPASDSEEAATERPVTRSTADVVESPPLGM